MDIFPRHPARILPYFGYRSRTRLTLTARALRAREADFSGGGKWRAFRTMLSQFASHEVAGLEVTLELERQDGSKSRHPVTTDSEGFARWDIALSDGWELTRHTAWEVAALHWSNDEGDHCVEGHIMAPGLDSHIAVISDIDDTIIETGITGSFRALARNWRRVLAELPDERLAVPGADLFYNALGGGHVKRAGEAAPGDRIPAMHRPFFYVSSSPWNLFSYLVAFKRARDLPLGPMMLRDWSFDRETLGSAGHGAHKRASIEAICDTYPEMRFALIGDDTQGDLPAYAAVVGDNPGRIVAVFIRTSALEEPSSEERAAKATIEAAGVPLWLGESYEIGQDFLKAAGLSQKGDTSRIVAVTDKKRNAAGATD
ncbi:phosphatase domain-containing protein [Altererythrobacter sp. ZODW24]|uniref:phosphatase domain-containing protein n=1 Tax=Altererythrobacter sp. ZODW24 TaxID=2185142 RepID=UPI000DF7A37F|nr:phosphatase domain-containing protein [Altererythrobacter sp. ZODW24]